MSRLGSDERSEYLAFARRIAREAGELTLKWFRGDPETQYKADATPVTIADRESERLLRRRISETYPTHGILGEEEAPVAGSEALTWVLDPIDGTKSFVLGVAQYAVLVALVSESFTGTERLATSAVEVGVIYIPPMDEMVSAGRGLGAQWQTGDKVAPACVSGHADLDGIRFGTTDFAGFRRKEPSLFDGLCDHATLSRTWGDAYGYALVATGRLDAMIDPRLSPWDLGPLPVVVEEAGGRYTDLNGDAVLGPHALASNGVLHDRVLALRR